MSKLCQLVSLCLFSSFFLSILASTQIIIWTQQTFFILWRSLLKIFAGQYTEAYEFLKEAHNLVPDNATVRKFNLQKKWVFNIQYRHSNKIIKTKTKKIINNMAFCLFYSGNLKDAIAFIEKQIHNNPRKVLNESLLFNLCTLYELESSKAQQKKANLLLWLNVYSGDGFNETSIQLQ